jgi:hypothetical protein
MPAVSDPHRDSLGQTVREVVERLAPLDRTPCSPGEREAAEWLAERLRAIGGVEVTLEDEPSWGTFPPTATGIGVVGLCGAGAVLARRRKLGALLALLTLAAVVDEAQNGPRVFRRLVRRRRSTVNLLARIGSAGEEPGRREIDTLVVLAHHDAPQTGLMFDQSLQKRVFELAPSLLAHSKKPPPQWWIGLAGPLLTLAAAAGAPRRLTGGAFAFGLLGVGMVADVWRSETVQGANDNLSGVAALVGLAESLEREPLAGMRVVLASCGAEETLQDGIRAFVARHRSEFDPRRTCFVNLDTIGSPHLVMLEGEGPIWMEEYAGAWLRDELERSAHDLGIGLERGFRARASTDSVIPSRAGYPIATLVSITEWRSPANYHLPTDIPENLVYESVVDATLLVRELAERLAER